MKINWPSIAVDFIVTTAPAFVYMYSACELKWWVFILILLVAHFVWFVIRLFNPDAAQRR